MLTSIERIMLIGKDLFLSCVDFLLVVFIFSVLFYLVQLCDVVFDLSLVLLFLFISRLRVGFTLPHAHTMAVIPSTRSHNGIIFLSLSDLRVL